MGSDQKPRVVEIIFVVLDVCFPARHFVSKTFLLPANRKWVSCNNFATTIFLSVSGSYFSTDSMPVMSSRSSIKWRSDSLGSFEKQYGLCPLLSDHRKILSFSGS